MRAIIKYPGAKWSIASWITSFFPEHHSYLEPFFGSGAVFFTKYESNIETINDLDGDVVNLFECIRADPERLAREVYFTPYARQVYDDAFGDSTNDRFRRARNFMVCCNMGHGFRTCGGKNGWKNDVQGRQKAYAVRYWNQIPDQIIAVAERLKEVQIENRPAIDLIRRFNFPNVLIYCDPPYLLGCRQGKQYRHEMNDHDHMELLTVLKEHKGTVVISGYDSEMYNAELSGWSKRTTGTVSQSGGAEIIDTEVVIVGNRFAWGVKMRGKK